MNDTDKDKIATIPRGKSPICSNVIVREGPHIRPTRVRLEKLKAGLPLSLCRSLCPSVRPSLFWRLSLCPSLRESGNKGHKLRASASAADDVDEEQRVPGHAASVAFLSAVAVGRPAAVPRGPLTLLHFTLCALNTHTQTQLAGSATAHPPSLLNDT